MDEQLVERLDVIGRDLKRRAHQLGQSIQEQDTALLMQALAVTIDAVSHLCKTTDRLDGPTGLGHTGE